MIRKIGIIKISAKIIANRLSLKTPAKKENAINFNSHDVFVC